MATQSYPTGMPDVLIASLSRTSVSPTKQVNPLKGPPVVIKWTDDQSDIWSITWRFSHSQKRAFDAWYFNNLNNGSLWFNINLPVGIDGKGQLRSQEANFNGVTPQGNSVDDAIHVTVSLIVRAVYRDTQEFTDGLLALIATGDDPDDIIDQLEQLVNVDLGEIA